MKVRQRSTRVLGGVYAVDNLAAALVRRAWLHPGESIITRDGVWIGQQWLRVSRDRDTHAGVIEREHDMRGLRTEVSQAGLAVRELEGALSDTRSRASGLEAQRDALQADVNRLHVEHSGLNAQLDASRERASETASRVEALVEEHATLDAQVQSAEEDLLSAQQRLEQALASLRVLEERGPTLENERERLRTDLSTARAQTEQDRSSGTRCGNPARIAPCSPERDLGGAGTDA